MKLRFYLLIVLLLCIVAVPVTADEQINDVLSDDVSVDNIDQSSSGIPVVFVYQKTSYAGKWNTSNGSSVNFADGVVTGSEITEGVYKNDTGYTINLIYPDAVVDITLDGVSIINKTIHPSDAPFLKYSVKGDNGYYTEGGQNLGLVFSNAEQGITNRKYFGGTDLSSNSWSEDQYNKYSGYSFAETGVWTVRAKFTETNEYGGLVSSTPPEYIYGSDYSFTVSEDAQATHYPLLRLTGPDGISLGDTNSYYIYAYYYDASGNHDSSQSILWTSSDPSIININPGGDLKVRNIGEVTIRAEMNSDSTVFAEKTVRVEETEIMRISGSSSPLKLTIGTKSYVYADIYDQFEKSVSSNMIEWEILEGRSNITLTKTGTYHHSVEITPVYNGSATIIAYPVSKPELKWRYNITVVDAPIEDPSTSDHIYLKWSGSSNNNLYLGAAPSTETATAYVYDIFNRDINGEEIIWTVDNESIVSLTVDPDVNHNTHKATLTPKSFGTTVINAAAKNNTLINASMEIHVLESVITSVDFLWHKYPDIMSLNTSEWDIVRAYDQYDRFVSNDSINITTIPEGLLQISASGKSSDSQLEVKSDTYVDIKAMNTGNVTIHAESVSNSSAYVKHDIVILPAYVPGEICSVKLSFVPDELQVGKSYSIYAKNLDKSEYEVPDTDILWTVDKPDILGFSVNETKTSSSVEIMGLAEGTATIRATSKQNESAFAEATIKVTPASKGSYVSIYRIPKNITLQSILSSSPYAELRDQYGYSTNEKLVWTVGNSSVLEISPNVTDTSNSVTIIPKSAGTTTIRASVQDDRTRYDEVTLTVDETIPTSVYMSPSKTTEMSLDSSRYMSVTAYVRDQFGYEIPEDIFWAVDGDTVLNLSYSTGKSIRIKPLSIGDTMLHASSANNSSIKFSIGISVVTPVVTKITISDTIRSNSDGTIDNLLLIGDTATIRGSATDQFSSSLSDVTLNWSVDRPDILNLSVNSSLPDKYITVTPISSGTAVITASNGLCNAELVVTVEVPVGKLITVNPLSVNITLGNTKSVSATVYNQGWWNYFFGETLHWSVDNTSVLSLSEESTKTSSSGSSSSGSSSITVTPMAAGTANITVYPESNLSLSRTIPVIVEYPEITSVSISGSSKLIVGDDSYYNYYLNGHAYDQFGYWVSNERLQWTVNNSDVVNLSKEYTITDNSGYSLVKIAPIAAGSAVVTITSDSNPLINASVNIIVEDPVVSRIKSESSSLKMSPGSTRSLYAYVYNQAGVSMFDESVCWTVDNPSVVNLSDTMTLSGKSIVITALGTGSANITLHSESNPSFVKIISVTVENPVIKSINAYVSSTLFIGNSYSYSASACGQFGEIVAGEMLSWSVDNPDILSISSSTSSSGEKVTLTPKSEGTAVLTVSSVTDPTIRKSVTITVEKEVISSLRLSRSNINMSTKSLDYVSAYPVNQYGNSVSDKVIIWSVENNSVVELSSPISISSKNVMIIPKSVGTTRITAYLSENTSISQSFDVTVYQSVPTRISISYSGKISSTVDSFVSVDAYQYIYAYVYDQFNISSTENISVEIADDSILQLTSSTEVYSSDFCNIITLNPRKAGSTFVSIIPENNVSAKVTYPVTVTENTLPKINIETFRSSNPLSATLPMSGVKQVLLFATDQFGNPLDMDKITWRISDESVFRIDSQDNIEYNSLIKMTYPYLKMVKFIPIKTGTTIVRAVMANNASAVSNTITMDVVEDSSVSSLSWFVTEKPDFSLYVVTSSNNGNYLLPLNSVREAGVIISDSYGNYLPNEDVEITADNPDIISWEKSEPVAGYYGITDCYGMTLTALNEGSTTLHAVSKSNPAVSSSIFIHVYNSTNISIINPPKKNETIPDTSVMPPDISPAACTFAKSQIVSMSTGTENAEIYYTTDGSSPTHNSNLYTEPITITETTLIKAVSFKGNKYSETVSALYTRENLTSTNSVSIAENNGGTISADKTSAAVDTLIKLTFTPKNSTWKLTGWTITGDVSGKTVSKSSNVSEFAMWGEPVTIYASFTEIIDQTPKPEIVKITNIPNRFYEDDTGTFNTIIYDQFGERLSYNTVTWKSENTSVLSINRNTGAYTAISGGATIVTATSVEDTSKSESIQVSVYVPPKPLVTGEISGPNTAYYGVMSDPYIVTTKYASHLNWNWGDGSKTSSMTEAFASLLFHDKDADWAYQSTDTVAHTFIELGDVAVTLTPSNTYRFGDPKTFHVRVTYAPPRNLKITNGASAVVGGTTTTYTAFATGADKFKWYLDDNEINGQTGPTVSIAFPIPNNPKTSEVRVVASKEGIECSSVSKSVEVSVPGGALGNFADITVNPSKPTKGEVSVFTINAVTNAVGYVWIFSDGTRIETTASSVSHVLKDTSTNKVTVTARNSVGAEKTKEYLFTPAGDKPNKPFISTDKTSAYTGETTSFTASSNSVNEWTWIIDGIIDSDAVGNTHSKLWTVDDAGKHLISVKAENEHGTSTQSIGYDVIPKPGKPAVIDKILGPSLMVNGTTATFSAVIKSNDEYSIAWYLNGFLLEDTTSVIRKELSSGTYSLKIVVTTEYEEISELEKTVVVKESDLRTKIKHDVPKSGSDNEQNLRLVDNSGGGVSAITNVESVGIDKSDISSDAERVSVGVTAVDKEDLYDFTTEMGDKKDALLSVDITPTGLNNEKDLNKRANITFSISKDEVSDPTSVQFFRLDTGSGVDQWVKLIIDSYRIDGDNYIFCVRSGGMSTFIATSVGVSDGSEDPVIPITERINTTNTWNAAVNIEIGYELSPSLLDTVQPPTFTHGANTIILNESVVVKKYINGVPTDVPATVNSDGTVQVNENIDDADYITVTFVGRKIGDASGDGVVSVRDSVVISRYLAMLDPLDTTGQFYANLEGRSNGVKVIDCIKIARYKAGLINENYI